MIGESHYHFCTLVFDLVSDSVHVLASVPKAHKLAKVTDLAQEFSAVAVHLFPDPTKRHYERFKMLVTRKVEGAEHAEMVGVVESG